MILWRFTLLAGLVAFALCSCQEEGEWGYEPGKGQNGGFFPGGGNNGSAHPNDSGGFGNGQINPIDLQNGIETEVEYPTLTYSGNGNVASIDARNPTKVATRQEFSAEFVKLHTTRFTSSDSAINDGVKKLVGLVQFTRTSKQELISKEDNEGFANLSFVMYGKQSQTNNGYGHSTSTYSSPVPIAVIPVDMPQYDILQKGPVTYMTSVTDGDGTRFDIVSSITQLQRMGTTIKIRQQTEIQGNDRDGKLYDKLHIPRITEYQIDTARKKILTIYSDDFYHNEERGRRNMTVELQLCTYTMKGQTETFPCPNY